MTGLKTFWCVTSSFDDHGRVAVNITQTVDVAEKPESSFARTGRKDIYNDWFGSLEEAQAYVEEARQA